jgi:UDP-glucose 4-epimerase
MSKRKMKVLVTGGAGFIGSHVVDRLVEGNYEVVVIDNLLVGERHHVPKGVRLVEVDILNFDQLHPYFEGAWGVIHAAAIPRIAWGLADPCLTTATNVLGTVNVLEAARRHKIRRFVHSSSYALSSPSNPYNVSKLAAEEYVRIYHELYGLKTISLRYSNVYGPRQSDKGPGLNLLPALQRSKKEHGKLFITGDGTQDRDLIYVTDVARANLLALQSDWTGWLDICTGRNTSLNQLASYFDCPIEYIGPPQGDAKSLRANPERAEKVLGFKAEIFLERGIRETLTKI